MRSALGLTRLKRKQPFLRVACGCTYTVHYARALHREKGMKGAIKHACTAIPTLRAQLLASARRRMLPQRVVLIPHKTISNFPQPGAGCESTFAPARILGGNGRQTPKISWPSALGDSKNPSAQAMAGMAWRAVMLAIVTHQAQGLAMRSCS